MHGPDWTGTGYGCELPGDLAPLLNRRSAGARGSGRIGEMPTGDETHDNPGAALLDGSGLPCDGERARDGRPSLAGSSPLVTNVKRLGADLDHGVHAVEGVRYAVPEIREEADQNVGTGFQGHRYPDRSAS